MLWLIAGGLTFVGAFAAAFVVHRADPYADKGWAMPTLLSGLGMMALGGLTAGWALFGIAVRYWVNH